MMPDEVERKEYLVRIKSRPAFQKAMALAGPKVRQ